MEMIFKCQLTTQYHKEIFYCPWFKENNCIPWLMTQEIYLIWCHHVIADAHWQPEMSLCMGVTNKQELIVSFHIIL